MKRERERSPIELALNELVGHSLFSMVFDQIMWSEDEVRRAQGRHLDQCDLLYHAAGPLLAHTATELKVEFIYRSHCRELLDRVATGGDTRNPTAAEMSLVLSEFSLHNTMTNGGNTLYMRIFARAFPEKVFGELSDLADAGERWGRQEADELERSMTRRMRQPWRVLGEITCEGKHWGLDAPDCPYIPGQEIDLTA